MTSTEVKQQLRNKLTELGYLKPGEILDDAQVFRDLGVDSMVMITVIVSFEQITDVLVPDYDLTMENFYTVRAFCDYFGRQ